MTRYTHSRFRGAFPVHPARRAGRGAGHDGRGRARCRQRYGIACGAALLAALLTVALAGPGEAQTRGATVPVDADADFTATGQSMWGPGDGARDPFSLQVFSESWDESGDDTSIRTFFGEQFGAEVHAGTSGQFEFRIVFPGAGDATVGVSYPVRFRLDVPEPNSFAAGETITVHTSHALRPGAALVTDPADLAMDFRGTLGFDFDVTGKFCAFGCSSNIFGPLFPVGGLLSDVNLFTLSDSPAFPGGVSVASLPHTFTSAETALSGLEGTVGLPRPTSTSVLGGDGSLAAQGSAHYVNTTLDLDILMHRLGLPPLQKSVPLSKSGESGSLSYTVAGADLSLDMFLSQSFGFEPMLFTTLSFESPVSWWVTDPSGATVASGTGTQATLEVGHDLHIGFPEGRVTPLGADPTFSLDGTFSNHTTHRTTGSFDADYGEFSFHVGKASWTDEVEDTICDVWDPTGLLCLITKTITKTLNRASEAISFSEGPFASSNESLGDETVTVFQDSWQLGGFSPSVGPGFALDPENPIIAIETSLTPGLLAGGDPGTAVQALTVRNEGDVPLSAVQVDNAITAALTGSGFGVLSNSSLELSTNAGFDGASDPATLDGSDVLAVGGSGTVTVTLSLEPGDVYDAAVAAHGTSPIGTDVSDHAGATLGVYAMDIVPRKIQRKSGGDLPVKLLSVGGLDVARVNPASTRLEGVAATDWEAGGGGSFLMLKFPRPDILAGLDARLNGGAVADMAAVSTRLPKHDDVAARALAVPTRAVAAALLGGPSELSDPERTALDRFGNENGRLDLGDLRARVLAGTGAATAAAEASPATTATKKGGKGPPGGPGGGSPGNGNGNGTVHTFILTGTLDDGTPFFAEATAMLIGG